MWFQQTVIQEIHSTAISRKLERRRDILLAGLPNQFTSTLQQAGSPADQLYNDLNEFNSTTGPIVGGVIPFEVWLRNAAYQVSIFPNNQKFFQDKASEIAKKAHDAKPPAEDSVKAADAELDTVEEREIFTNDLLPIGFLAGAARTEKSVARLLVPRFDDTATTKVYFGTGWLIGKSYIITNYHVTNARDPGEPEAGQDDLKKQALGTSVQFDYNADGSAFDEKPVDKLVVANKEFDYAILRLKDDPGRPPLILSCEEVTLPSTGTIALNIIQHPGGAPKQIGLRNNLAAKITSNNLAYFTDTKGGSSGSPVCNDQWQVVALHKAATRTFGSLKFQGKETEWVNIGTRIDRIIADLKANHADLWSAIDA